MISLRLDEPAEKFRAEFELWLKDNKPPQLPGRVELDEFVKISSAWQNKLSQARFVGVHWPEQYGGRGLRIVEEAISQELLALHGSPQLVNLFGLTMIGPVLIEHGTEAQKKRFLSKILSAEEIWCQGFSEPQAGSDLANLKTVAEKDPQTGNYLISGQKVWTSFAQYAAWCFVLVRTDSAVARHKGLSYLLMPMSSAGLTVRPLQQISGDKEFNELFFDRVSVPAENLVGQPGDGWKIAISTLMYERVVLTFARHLQSENLLLEIRDAVKKRGASEAVKQRLGQLLAQNMGVRALALSHLTNYGKDKSPGPEGSLDKLGWSETFQEICKLGMEILGPDAILTGGKDSYLEGQFPFQYLYSRGRTIAAGTSEIQRNIIAERVLGLPRN